MQNLSSLTGMEPAPPALEGRILTTGWPGKSQSSTYDTKSALLFHVQAAVRIGRGWIAQWLGIPTLGI